MPHDPRWLRRITRRDFLEGVLVTAAGSALGCSHALRGGNPRSHPLPGELFSVCHALADGHPFAQGATEPGIHDALVLGAGLSGLAAAWTLVQHGLGDVVVLEKEPVVGGQARAMELAGLRCAAGAAYSLPPWGQVLTDLYRALGVVPAGSDKPADEYLAPEPANRSFYAGQWVDDAWGAGMDRLPLDPIALADLKSLKLAVTGYGSITTSDGKPALETPADDASRDPAIRGLDEISLTEWARSRGWRPEAVGFFDPYCRSAMGLEADQVSAWAAINFLQAEFGPTLTRPGGTAYLGERLAGLVGAERIRLGQTVVRVEAEQEAVRVTAVDAEGRPTTMRARRVIFALPKFLARHVWAVKDTRYDEAWGAFTYGPYLVANLSVSAIAPGTHYDNWLHPDAKVPPEDRLVTDFIVADSQTRKGGTGPGVLTVYCPVLAPYTRSQVLKEPFDVWAERIVRQLARAVPGLRKSLLGIDLFRWGHAVVLARPGFVFGKARASSCAPLGPFHFAHTDVDGSPSVEGALTHGVRAAREIVLDLGR